MNVATNKKGFTIIEVVLVLAIAALIFLMIFVAFPALQRGQKNTARKNDLSTIAAAVNTYRSNNSGSLPTDTDAFEKYIDKLSQVQTVNVKPYSEGGDLSTDDDTNVDTVTVFTGAKCNDDSTIGKATSAKSAAVQGVSEVSSGKYANTCQGV